jgi:hypothetical protein
MQIGVHTAHTAKPILVSYMAMHTRKKYTVDTCSLLWVYELLAFWPRILVKLENINLLVMRNCNKTQMFCKIATPEVAIVFLKN